MCRFFSYTLWTWAKKSIAQKTNDMFFSRRFQAPFSTQYLDVQGVIIVQRSKWIAVHVSVLVRVYLYMSHAMRCPALWYSVRCSTMPHAMVYDAACRPTMTHGALRCDAMSHSTLHDALRSAVMPCTSLPCPTVLHAILCNATWPCVMPRDAHLCKL